jgi:group I intron endonuclease
VASGIYKILCLSDGKSYIGSAKNLSKRWWTHRRALNQKQHDNIHLQHAWNKYGASNFEFSVVEYVEDPNNLLIAEQRWLDTTNNLFNICLVAGSCVGRVVSPETKNKISRANTGRVLSPETRMKISEASKKRIRQGVYKGKNNPFWGKVHSKETKFKMSQSKLGNSNGKGRKTGFTHSNETKIKMRFAALQRWAKCREVS